MEVALLAPSPVSASPLLGTLHQRMNLLVSTRTVKAREMARLRLRLALEEAAAMTKPPVAEKQTTGKKPTMVDKVQNTRAKPTVPDPSLSAREHDQDIVDRRKLGFESVKANKVQIELFISIISNYDRDAL